MSIMSLLPTMVHYGMCIKTRLATVLGPLIEALKGEIYQGALNIVNL